MGIEIRDEIKSSATWCNKNLSCLSPENKDLCKIAACVDQNFHLIVNEEPKYCSYQNSSVYGKSCSCPVRKEIYNKYRK
jgi:hypothetical protein